MQTIFHWVKGLLWTVRISSSKQFNLDSRWYLENDIIVKDQIWVVKDENEKANLQQVKSYSDRGRVSKAQ